MPLFVFVCESKGRSLFNDALENSSFQLLLQSGLIRRLPRTCVLVHFEFFSVLIKLCFQDPKVHHLCQSRLDCRWWRIQVHIPFSYWTNTQYHSNMDFMQPTPPPPEGGRGGWLFPENGRWPPHVGGVRLGWRLGWKTIFLIVSRGQTIHPTPVWGPHTEPKFRADRNRAIVWTKRPKKMPLFDRNVPKWPVLGYTHFLAPAHFPYRHGQVLKTKKVSNLI